MFISTVAHVMQRPGAEEFACLSLLVQKDSKHSFQHCLGPESNGLDFIPAIQEAVADCPHRVTLTAVLVHEVDSRASTFSKCAKQAVVLPELWTSLPDQRAELGQLPTNWSEGTWMLRPPESQQTWNGRPLLSGCLLRRPRQSVNVLLAAGLANESHHARQSEFSQQLPTGFYLVALELNEAPLGTEELGDLTRSAIQKAIQVASFQAGLCNSMS
jgi:hypothetical protein